MVVVSRTDQYPLISKIGRIEARDASVGGKCEIHEMETPEAIAHLGAHLADPGGVNACPPCLRQVKEELEQRMRS